VEQVGLSEGQLQQVDSIMRYYRDQMRALHEEFDEAYSSRYRELQAASREAVRGVLTTEQVVVYDSIRGEWRQRWEESRQDTADEVREDRNNGRRGPGVP
jgi:hypothetical protein